MPYSAVAIANCFIDLAKKSGDKGLTPMKLQKLVYFAHGWHLALTGNPLIKEEIQAWKFGPVVQSLYHEFKEYGNNPISNYASDFRLDDKSICVVTPTIPEDSQAFGLLKRIWEVYGKYGGVQLSNATHLPNTPWYEVWEKEGKNKQCVGIPDDIIKKHFEAELEKQKAKTAVAA